MDLLQLTDAAYIMKATKNKENIRTNPSVGIFSIRVCVCKYKNSRHHNHFTNVFAHFFFIFCYTPM